MQMMDIIIQLIVSFCDSWDCHYFNVPRKTLLHCGLVGVIGWIIYYVLTEQGMDVVKASFLAHLSLPSLLIYMPDALKYP